MCDRERQRGAFTLPAVASIGVLLLSFVLASQVAVWVYAKGALRSAAQAAARSASPLDAPAGSCERSFERVREQLLGGEVGNGVGVVRCNLGAEFVTVDVDAHFAAWLPITPDWNTTITATSVREVEPR